jgi:predicted NUDIX family NTP pyrophosphohydrolase
MSNGARKFMPKKSAGLLLYRYAKSGLEVLLVHPGGPFWAKRDEGAWSIPKGEFDDAEDPLAAAQREFREETGVTVSGEFQALAPIRQAGGKVVYAWIAQIDLDPSAIKSNTFSIEWPPRTGKKREFPEIDRAEWFAIDSARRKILKSQAALLDQLQQIAER